MPVGDWLPAFFSIVPGRSKSLLYQNKYVIVRVLS